MIGCRESVGTMLFYKKRLEDANWKMNVEVFIMNNKLQAKDLINLGLFTVLYFVIGCCVAIPIGFVPIFLPVLGSLWSLITGIPFMLFLTRVKKFGMVTIMGVLSGLLMGLTGMGFWGVPMGLIFGLLGDLILKSGDYKRTRTCRRTGTCWCARTAGGTRTARCAGRPWLSGRTGYPGRKR